MDGADGSLLFFVDGEDRGESGVGVPDGGRDGSRLRELRERSPARGRAAMLFASIPKANGQWPTCRLAREGCWTKRTNGTLPMEYGTPSFFLIVEIS
jgi:hypothetical protein